MISNDLNDWFSVTNEHYEQSLVLQWADTQLREYPELKWLYAIPNGGKRHISVAVRMKKEGVKPGVPDLCLPCARGGYNALYIEMKRLKPRATKTKGVVLDRTQPTAEQNEWRAALEILGNLVLTCWTAEEAQNCIKAYLDSDYIKMSA